MRQTKYQSVLLRLGKEKLQQDNTNVSTNVSTSNFSSQNGIARYFQVDRQKGQLELLYLKTQK